MVAKAIEFNGWCIVTGQDFREIISVKDPSLPKIPNPEFDPECEEDPIKNPKELFQPKDLTGFSSKMDIRTKEGHQLGTLIIALATGGNGIIIGSPNPTDGIVEIFIDNLVTKISPISENLGDQFYDLFLIPSLGDNQRISFGKIKIVDATTDV